MVIDYRAVAPDTPSDGEELDSLNPTDGIGNCAIPGIVCPTTTFVMFRLGRHPWAMTNAD